MNIGETIFSGCTATLRMSAPLVFTAIGGMFSERCGVINIALEGKMLIGAFVAASVTYYTKSPWIGFLAGGIAGLIVGAIYGLFVITFRANQIVTGIAINILIAGSVPFISQILFKNTGSTPELPILERFTYFPIVTAWLVVICVWAWLRYSPYGLWHRFAGEHPDALQTSGIDVIQTRWSGVLLSGFLAGLGGSTLSICLSSNYTRNMTAGRGYMALAALIMGSWKTIRIALACLIFGLFDFISIMLQSTPLNMSEISIPSFSKSLNFLTSPQFIQIIPYVLTVVIVVGFVGKSLAPKALGRSYERKR